MTGIPTARVDHAVAMAKFAGDMLSKLDQELHRLTDRLGAETLGLAMRVGLHSGPVTAGVLRGEKARFQLFGDSVNTAARIESNGKANRIHASDSTAKLLIQSGKSHWVKPREDTIIAKGKGEMKTFWIQPHTNRSVMTSSENGAEEEDGVKLEEKAQMNNSFGSLSEHAPVDIRLAASLGRMEYPLEQAPKQGATVADQENVAIPSE